MLEEGVIEFTLIVSVIVIGDLTNLEDTLSPVTAVLNTIITSEFTLSVEFVVIERTSVRATVGEGQLTLTVVETVLENTLILDVLSVFNTGDGQVILEFTFELVVFIRKNTVTLSLEFVIKITLENHTRLVDVVTFFVLNGVGLLSTSLVLDFLLEGIDFRSIDLAFFIEVVTEVLDEANPLVDVDSLVVGVIEEGDDVKNLAFGNTTGLSVLGGESDVGDFEGVGEELGPELETVFGDEVQVEIVG